MFAEKKGMGFAQKARPEAERVFEQTLENDAA